MSRPPCWRWSRYSARSAASLPKKSSSYRRGSSMWWPERRAARGRVLGPIAALAIAGLTAGCSQPLYGDRSLTGTPVIRGAMAQVDVAQIDATAGTALARLAVEVRNELLYGLTGG